jgi:hypothetical protein
MLLAALWIAGDRRAFGDTRPLFESWATLGAASLIGIGLCRFLQWRNYDGIMRTSVGNGRVLRPNIARTAFIDLAFAFPAAPLYAALLVIGDNYTHPYGLMLLGTFILSPIIGIVWIYLVLQESDRRGRKYSGLRRPLQTSDQPDHDESLFVVSPPVLAGVPFGALLYATCAFANMWAFFMSMPLN